MSKDKRSGNWLWRLSSFRVAGCIAVLGLCAIQSGGAPTKETGCIAVVRSFVHDYYAHGEWARYLSAHWHEIVRDDWIKGLDASYESLNVGITDIEVTRLADERAVVKYCCFDVSHPTKKAPPSRTYLVKEGGRWLIDNPFGGTPEWAIDEKMLPTYRAILSVITGIKTMAFKHNPELIRMLASDDSLLEYGEARLIAVLSEHPVGEALGPINVTLGPIKTCGNIPFMNVHVSYLARVKGPDGKEKYRIFKGTEPLVNEQGHWKTPLARAHSGEEVIGRFLDLWRKGDREVASRFLLKDATIDKGSGIPVNLPIALPKLPVPIRVGGLHIDFSGGKSNGHAVNIQFPKDADLSSGDYFIETKTVIRFDLAYSRIKAIRLRQ